MSARICITAFWILSIFHRVRVTTFPICSKNSRTDVCKPHLQYGDLDCYCGLSIVYLGMMHSTVLLKYSIRDYFSCRFLCKQIREFWSIFIFKWKFKWHYAKITTTELYLLMLSILIHLTIFIFEMMQKRILRPPIVPTFLMLKIKTSYVFNVLFT